MKLRIMLLASTMLIGCAKKDNEISFTCYSSADRSKTHALKMDSGGQYIIYDGRKLSLRNASLGEGEWNYAFYLGANYELVGLIFNNALTTYRHYPNALAKDSNSFDDDGDCDRPLERKV